MRWTIEFPIQVYAAADDSDELEPRLPAEAPLSVKNAVAEACWSLGQALTRTAHQVTVVATIEEPTSLEEEDNGKKIRR